MFKWHTDLSVEGKTRRLKQNKGEDTSLKIPCPFLIFDHSDNLRLFFSLTKVEVILLHFIKLVFVL